MTEAPDSENEQTVSQQFSLQDALQLAMRLHQAKQFDSAEAIYRQLLELDANNADLLHFFGLLRHQRGAVDEGTALIKKALELAPEYVDAQNNLGNIYLETGHPELAEPCFRRVLALNPSFTPAYANLGIALRQLEQFEAAICSLSQAIAFEPEEAHYYENLGNVYLDAKRYREAVENYLKSIELQPNSEIYSRLSMTLNLMGEVDNSIKVLNQWLALDPANPLALHMLAAYSGANTPLRASDDYIRHTFNGFAASFDGVLKRLDYRAPFLVHEALLRLAPDPDTWRLLDAGCGTGLCGALVRPLVKHLAGVDLSPKMLDRARVRGVYDALFEAELTGFFAQAQAEYDVICCVDTFCYFGDLTQALTSAVNALRSGGWFVFTLEEMPAAVADFHLEKHGRYCHNETYVKKTLTTAGFQVRHFEKSVLRKESNAPVNGLVITAQLI